MLGIASYNFIKLYKKQKDKIQSPKIVQKKLKKLVIKKRLEAIIREETDLFIITGIIKGDRIRIEIRLNTNKTSGSPEKKKSSLYNYLRFIKHNKHNIESKTGIKGVGDIPVDVQQDHYVVEGDSLCWFEFNITETVKQGENIFSFSKVVFVEISYKIGDKGVDYESLVQMWKTYEKQLKKKEFALK